MKYESCDARSGCTFEHIMHVLTGLGYRDAAYQQLYRQLFKNGGIVDRDITYPDARNVVEAIVHDGGVPVLAHPAGSSVYEVIPDLVEAGLMGLEKYHPEHDEQDHERIDALASRYNLLKTGGSDYHGILGGPERLGLCCVDPHDRTHTFNALFSLGVVV